MNTVKSMSGRRGPGRSVLLPPPPAPAAAPAAPSPGRGRDSLQEAGDVLAAAAGPGEGHGVVQELWRHDERPFPNGLAVVAASVVLNAEAAWEHRPRAGERVAGGQPAPARPARPPSCPGAGSAAKVLCGLRKVTSPLSLFPQPREQWPVAAGPSRRCASLSRDQEQPRARPGLAGRGTSGGTVGPTWPLKPHWCQEQSDGGPPPLGPVPRLCARGVRAATSQTRPRRAGP